MDRREDHSFQKVLLNEAGEHDRPVDEKAPEAESDDESHQNPPHEPPRNQGHKTDGRDVRRA
ncbi:hypothetical protein T484DRAFT_1935514 [Baffinella frigidus]|nr:hypothetical protein T484DRAFT_1935514 [Cryptophyta sp. CCMP2293]